MRHPSQTTTASTSDLFVPRYGRQKVQRTGGDHSCQRRKALDQIAAAAPERCRQQPTERNKREGCTFLRQETYHGTHHGRAKRIENCHPRNRWF